TMLTPYDQVLQDRRPARDLQVEELQRRVQAYDYAANNPGFAQGSRADWQDRMKSDRMLLRARMKEERHRREAELAMQASQGEYDVEISDAPPPRRRPRSYVAAEIDNQQIEEVLTSRAAPGFQKRYRVDEIASQPQLRDAVQRIDVDTIHFGYNESFIREEELGNIDAIAEIIERIVRKYPNEVFLIEGNTDAPGSAAYNLALSKKRADSVKAALTAYYVIPAKNLRTVGLGARFLKIPTADPEPENRRVSISRITDLLGAN
ncbi:MAG: OmpA family protein, partial [Aestuariivirga sp.]